jgi:23S rRNA pseudouridine1911/1915/1917 synthase
MSTKPPLESNQTTLSVIEAENGEVDPIESGAVETRKLQIPHKGHGERLDRALCELMPEFSRSHLQHLIAQGCVQGQGGAELKKPALRVKAGQFLSVLLRPTEESLAYTPQAMDLQSVYVDEHFRVINKPAGLVVHPAPGNWSGTLLNGLLALDEAARLLPRAGIVHRLDKDTSGLMMVARTRAAMDALVQGIAARRVKREYLALVHGQWPHAADWRLDGAIGRDPKNRLRMAVLDAATLAAKPAVTHVSCVGHSDGLSLLHCRLETGRTHQIRVHLSHHGYPLVGDALYGGAPAHGLVRQGLHAWRLGLAHPISGEPLSWQCEPPEDLAAVLQISGLGYNLPQS